MTVIALDAPKRHCPWCDQEVGPISGIHWKAAIEGDYDSPNSPEECELRQLRKLCDKLLAWRGKRNLSAMSGGVELISIALDAEKLVLRRSAIDSESQKGSGQ